MSLFFFLFASIKPNKIRSEDEALNTEHRTIKIKANRHKNSSSTPNPNLDKTREKKQSKKILNRYVMKFLFFILNSTEFLENKESTLKLLARLLLWKNVRIFLCTMGIV
jgi:hypothetical protein